MTAIFKVEALAEHDRRSFDCGDAILNEYLRKRAGQDMKRRVAFCYVAIEQRTSRLAGFYTLAACGVPLTDLPPATARKLPRYPMVPAVRIGRLAVDCEYHGQKLGSALLYDALRRSARSGVAAFAAIVDAKGETAAHFYEHHGFRRFTGSPLTLFLPISATVADHRLSASQDLFCQAAPAYRSLVDELLAERRHDAALDD